MVHGSYLCPLCKVRSNVIWDEEPLPHAFCPICEDRLERGFIHLCDSCGHLYYEDGNLHTRANPLELYGTWKELKEVMEDISEFSHQETCIFCEMEHWSKAVTRRS